MRILRRYAALIVLALIVVPASVVRLPYYSIGPGPAREVEPLIHVTGPTLYPSEGRFVMTSITFAQLTGVGVLAAWLDPTLAVVPRSALFAPGESVQAEQRRAISQMDQSKIDAVFVVLKLLEDYPMEHGRGALVESVVAGCAATGSLFPGDVILSIDGHAIDSRSEASMIIDSVASGESLTFRVRAGGETQTVSLQKRRCGVDHEPLVGVALFDNFPFPVKISSGDIGGPSAGLMWALGLYDLLTPGDLTGGRTIAGTGQIEVDGRIDPIGGIGEKVIAAAQAGADVLLVPRQNLAEARAAGESDIQLVPVSNFQEALDYLEGSA